MTALPSEALLQVKNKATAALSSAKTLAELETWRVQYLGRKGVLPLFLRRLKDLPLSERRALGPVANSLREELELVFSQKNQELNQKNNHTISLKPTGDNLKTNPGHLHPLTQTLRQIQHIFSQMGFQLVEGPNVEESRYNFDDLNIPLEHPARAETDTFYLSGHPDLVLRTHVSPLQIRGVKENNLQPPFKLMYYGPTFRAEKEDATHGSLFQQYEFLVVSEKVSLADLKAIIKHVYSEFFGTAVAIRFRPSYFPFVEPGLEVDMEDKVTGKGQWLEMAGAGLVHPHVLKAMGVDPDRYQGIALGGGLDRLAMLKYRIPDIRLFYANDFHFLRQF